MLIEVLKPKAKMVLVVMAFFFGMVTITTQSNLAYAASTEKIPLVQQYEQFPGQEVTGFCNVRVDDDENLHWQIKVYGLEPGTKGLFDMGHWAGEVDVSYTADDDGNADSKNQIVLAKNVPHSMFSQFAKCHVRASGDSHLDHPGIAFGVSGSNEDADETQNEKDSPSFLPEFAFGIPAFSDEDSNENQKLVSTEKKSFIFYSLHFVLEILKNDHANVDKSQKVIPNEKSSNPSGLEKTKKRIPFSAGNSVFGPHLPPSYNQTVNEKFIPDKEIPAKNVKLKDSGKSNDKGKGESKGERSTEVNSKEKCNKGKQKKGLC